ncbi:uncharacterized protein LOC143225314 [Tachypleus tridentatus]|uniref:uncharacterized protein LOC143225314 n=1 Tax=Tachypleus tridentatus TaxID=6853 RepID=UPI003FD2A7A1
MTKMDKSCLILIITTIIFPVLTVKVTEVLYPEEDLSTAAAEVVEVKRALPTVTVRGFLNFRTTVDNTVIVFTPANSGTKSSPSLTHPPSPSSTTTPNNAENSKIQDLGYSDSPQILKADHDLENAVRDSYDPKPIRNVIRSTSGTSKKLHLSTSTQTAPTVAQQRTPVLPQYPTGLVTVVTGKNVHDGTTIFQETSVIGTYIDGKYAQILKSSSKIGIPLTTTSSRSTSTRINIKPSPSKAMQFTTSRATLAGNSKDRPILSNSKQQTSTIAIPLDRRVEQRQNIVDRKKDEGIVSNAVLQSSFKPVENGQQWSSNPTQSLDAGRTSTSRRLRFRPRPTTSKSSNEENTLLKLRSLRRPIERFRYVPRQKNTHTVQLNRFKVRLRNRSNDHQEKDELETETENVEEDDVVGVISEHSLISVDPSRVINEMTTITSEVTLHVGRRKSVRTLTITTTVQRTLEPSELIPIGLTDNSKVDNDFLPSLSSSYHVISRTYSTTEHTWRTSLVPIEDGETKIMHTVTESFIIRKMITAYRTVPADDLLLNETLESELEIPFGDDSEDDLRDETFVSQSSVQQETSLQKSNLDPSMLSLSSPGSLPLQIANPLLSLGAALNRNPLAAVYLGLQQLNRQATLYSTVTKTTSYVTTATVYSTKVVRFYNGRNTHSRTLSESLSTTVRTVTTHSTTLQPIINTQASQLQQQLQDLIRTQLQPPGPPQYSTVTSSYTTVTMATSTSTHIYTLTYNAFSTKYRTVTSTSLYLTTISTYSTSEVPILATTPPGSGYQFYG